MNPNIDPATYKIDRFNKEYFPKISALKLFFIKLFGKRMRGATKASCWIWYEFRGKRYYTAYYDVAGNRIKS